MGMLMVFNGKGKVGRFSARCARTGKAEYTERAELKLHSGDKTGEVVGLDRVRKSAGPEGTGAAL